MRTFNRLPTALAAAAMALFLMTGCGDSSTPDGDADSHAGHTDDDHDHDGHDDHEGHDDDAGHAHTVGPHDGHLIESADGKYIAEWAHDDEKETVTVYFHEHGSKEDHAIAAKEVTIEVTLDETSKTYQLKGMDEEAEKNSQFQLKDWALLSSLQAEETKATLTVEMDGKTYKFKIEHHDH